MTPAGLSWAQSHAIFGQDGYGEYKGSLAFEREARVGRVSTQLKL